MHLRFMSVSAAVLSLSLAACNNTPTVAQTTAIDAPEQGMLEVRYTGFDDAYINPEAQLSHYRVVKIEPLNLAEAKIVQPERAPGLRTEDWTLTPERQARLQDMWNASSQKVLASANPAGAKALRIDAKLTRIAPSSNIEALEKSPSRTIVFTEDSGDFSVEFRLFDADSGALLAIINDKREAGSRIWQRTSRVQVNADIRQLFNSWSQNLATLVSNT